MNGNTQPSSTDPSLFHRTPSTYGIPQLQENYLKILNIGQQHLRDHPTDTENYTNAHNWLSKSKVLRRDDSPALFAQFLKKGKID